jgi:hypothetical protein
MDMLYDCVIRRVAERYHVDSQAQEAFFSFLEEQRLCTGYALRLGHRTRHVDFLSSCSFAPSQAWKPSRPAERESE